MICAPFFWKPTFSPERFKKTTSLVPKASLPENSSLVPSWCGRWACWVPTLPGIPEDLPEQPLCSFGTCLLPLAWGVPPSSCSTGMGEVPAAIATPAVPLWLCYFCLSCAKICNVLEPAWVKLRGNASRGVSNTVGCNKTRVSCNGYLQKEEWGAWFCCSLIVSII